MGNYRPLPTKCWENYLKFLGYSLDRTSSSHHQWTKKGHRTIPVWGNSKEIPALHLKTSSRTLNCTMEDIYRWADENC